MANFIQPIIGMIGVTAGVWGFMYVKRLNYLNKHNLDPQSINTSEKINSVLPDAVNFPSNNLKNLFEMPVLFYVLCLASEQYRTQDLLSTNDWMLKLAWAYVVFRGLHSLVQCTYNKVMHRFSLYFLSCIVLWIMAVKVAMLAWA